MRIIFLLAGPSVLLATSGTLTNTADPKLLNVFYNVADFVNKFCFVLSCWTSAKADSVNKWA